VGFVVGAMGLLAFANQVQQVQMYELIKP